MSKQPFAPDGLNNRHPGLPSAMVNRPLLTASAAGVFTLLAAVAFTLLDRPPAVTREERSANAIEPPRTPSTADIQSRVDAEISSQAETDAPQPQAFIQPAAENIATPAPTPPITVDRSAEPVPETGPIRQVEKTEKPVEVVAQARKQQAVAAIDPEEAKPRQAIASKPGAPIECLPAALRAVLVDLQARFGSVTIISTTHLHTENHSPRSTRAKLHAACKAVDITTSKEPKEVIAYLRSRPEIGGVNSYRNRVVHFDLNASYKPSSARNAGSIRQPRAAVAAPTSPAR